MDFRSVFLLLCVASLSLCAFTPKNVEIDQGIDDHLLVKFKGPEITQMFLHLVPQKDAKHDLYIMGKYADGVYRFRERISSIHEELGYAEGKCDIFAVAGSVSDKKYERIGDFDLPKSSNALSEKEKVYRAREELYHIFKEPESRPLEFTSKLFTILVVAPLPLLLLLILLVGGNINLFFKTSEGLGRFLSNLGFTVTLGAILALYVLFWLYLNMAQTLAALLPLMCLLLTFGYYTLKYHPISRE